MPKSSAGEIPRKFLRVSTKKTEKFLNFPAECRESLVLVRTLCLFQELRAYLKDLGANFCNGLITQKRSYIFKDFTPKKTTLQLIQRQ
jgi:hypothetical protein